MQQREWVEMLALAMFFGATSDPVYHENQGSLSQLFKEPIAYEGRGKVVEEEIAAWNTTLAP